MKHGFVVTNERLYPLISNLEKGCEIDNEMRRLILEALYDLSLYNQIEEKKHQRGRPVAAETWLAAAITKEIMEQEQGEMLMWCKRKLTLKLAIPAAAPNASVEEHDAIERAYRKLKSGAHTLGINLPYELVSDAKGRLYETAILGSKPRKQKPGN